MALKALGKTTSGTKFVLPDDAVTQKFALLARSGAGKTNTAVCMAEAFLEAKRFIIVIDPVGVWWGLRSSHDGKAPGFPVLIMGGEHADVPLEPTSGKAVAEFLAADRVPTILDVSLFREGEMRRFIADFGEEFYRLNRQACHIFMDEADEYAPQQSFGPDTAKSLSAVQNLVRRGRARGIGATLITQRSAVINKSVLNMTECLIALQMTAPQDIEAIGGWLKYHSAQEARDKILSSLPSFQVGQAWVYSPGWLKTLVQLQIRRRDTFDSSATPTAGEEMREPKTLAEIDLGKLSTRIQGAAEQAKANDPKELRKKIAELQRQAASTTKTVSVDAGAVNRAIADRDRFWKKREAELIGTIKRHVTVVERSRKLLEEVHLNGESIPATPAPAALGPITPPEEARKLMVRAMNVAARRGSGEIGTGGLRRMLVALAQRTQGMTARQLGVRAGLSSRSGTFSNYLSSGKTNGWMEGGRDHLRITEEGLSALGDYDPLPTGPSLLSYWLSELGESGGARMLTALSQAYPKALTKEELGERSGLSASSGTFSNYLSKLRSLELIDGKGELVMSEELA